MGFFEQKLVSFSLSRRIRKAEDSLCKEVLDEEELWATQGPCAPRSDDCTAAGHRAEEQLLVLWASFPCRDVTMEVLSPRSHAASGIRGALPGTGRGLSHHPESWHRKKQFKRGWVPQRLPLLKFSFVFFLLEIVSKLSSNLIAQNLWSTAPVQIKENSITECKCLRMPVQHCTQDAM